MSTAIILRSRPEIIKLSPVIRECEQNNLDFFILHTGQHYSYEMDRVFFEQLGLPDARYNLDIGSAPHAEQTVKMLMEIGKVLTKEQPDSVLADRCSNRLFAPTQTSRDTLLNEGIDEDKIFVPGNTIVDVVYQNLEIT